MQRRVVITGMGVVSPLGSSIERFWSRIGAGFSGVRRIGKFDASDFACQIAGEVIEFDVDSFITKKEQRRLDEYSQYAIAAADMAIEDSGREIDKRDPERCGVIVGSGVGGLHTVEIAHIKFLKNGPYRPPCFAFSPKPITQEESFQSKLWGGLDSGSDWRILSSRFVY